MRKTSRKKHPHAFLDGRVIPLEAKLLKRLTPGRIKAPGVFETLLYDEGTVFLFDRHWSRLKKGLKILKMSCPYSRREMRRAIQRLLELNRPGCARVRLMVWCKRNVHAAIVIVPYRPYPAGTYKKGFRVFISGLTIKHLPGRPAVKAVKYQPFADAYRDAIRRGCDEALLCNDEGYVVEASRANIFVVREGRLIAPRLTDGCLNGITRRVVLRLAKDRGIPCRTARISPRDLLGVGEIFLTNSLVGVMPVSRIRQHTIGAGQCGKMTRQLQAAYRRYLSGLARNRRGRAGRPGRGS